MHPFLRRIQDCLYRVGGRCCHGMNRDPATTGKRPECFADVCIVSVTRFADGIDAKATCQHLTGIPCERTEPCTEYCVFTPGNEAK